MAVLEKISPVILCGGTGTRLWPMSRAARPKQFLPLIGDLSLFQQTLRRVADRERYDAPIIVTNSDYRFLVAEQAQEVGVRPDAILLEPVARNTAPAIAAAARFGLAQAREQVLLVLASDHEIKDAEEFHRKVDQAARVAAAGYLVTFGITPTEPATGYGYVEVGAEIDDAHRVDRFVEKPPQEEAERMLSAGNYLWNSGMFAFRRDILLEECRRHAPAVHAAACAAVEAAKNDLDFVRLDEGAFAASPAISIDHAIFEETDRAVTVPSSFGWSDLGSWDAVWKSSSKDVAENVVRGPVNLINTSGSLVFSESLHVAVNGMEEVVVIASPDVVYVGRLSESQCVGDLVKSLKASPGTAALTENHLTNYRPWGGYSQVLQGERFQVKRLFVKPGKKLSLQQHHHRAEHWVVVRGTAEVTVGEQIQTLTENQSVYIPLGEVHRLANPGKMLLELIEVQTGSYLGEDDIVRMADEFGRV